MDPNDLGESRALSGLFEIATALTSTKTHEDVLQLLVGVIARMVEVVRCSVILAAPGDAAGRVVATYENPALKSLSIDLAKYPEISEAVGSGQLVFIEDIVADARMQSVAPLLAHLDIRSILVIPITYREQVLGTLFLRTSRPRRAFTAQELLFCQTAAKMAANTLLALAEHEALVELNEQLATQASRDPLTGLLHHGSLALRVEQAFAAAERAGRPLSYLMLDLDQFKQVNDTFGHEGGDQALQRVAQAILQAIRKSDMAARYGGDEFAILLPDTDTYGAYVQAERIRRAVQQIRLKPEHLLSVSVGTATFPAPGTTTKEELMRQADQALYMAKTGGRNRTMSFATMSQKVA